MISTEKKNRKGFHVRTAGIDFSDYVNNPILLYLHQRPTGKTRDEVGVLGNVLDLEVKENELLGFPAFDDTDDFAMKLFNKYENGTMRAVSAGLIPLKWGKDSEGGIWLEKSKLYEISLADIGANFDSLPVTLYNENQEVITLSLDQIQENLKPEIKMNGIQLTDAAPVLGLAADATENDALEAMKNIVQLAADREQEIVTLKADNETLKGDVADANKKYDDLVEEHAKKENEAVVLAAVTDGKILEGDDKGSFVKVVRELSNL